MNKRTSAGKAILLVLLVLVLLPPVLAAGLYLYLQNAPVLTQEVDTILAQPGVTPASRMSVSASERTLTFSLDKADVYWVMRQQGIAPDCPEIADALAGYGLTVKGWSIQLKNGSLRLNCEALFREKLLLPLHADIQLELDAANRLTGIVTGLQLGGISLPLDKIEQLLPQSAGINGLAIPVTQESAAAEMHPLLEDCVEIALKEDALDVTCLFERRLFLEETQVLGAAETFARFVPGVIASPYAVWLGYGVAEPAVPWAKKLAAFEADPAELIEFKLWELAEADAVITQRYCAENAYRDRFFCEIDAPALAAQHQAMAETCIANKAALETLMGALLSGYEQGDFSLDPQQGLVTLNKRGKITGAFTLEGYLGADWAGELGWMDVSALHLIDASGVSSALCPAGLLLRMADGSPAVAFYSLVWESRVSKKCPLIKTLPETLYQELAAAQGLPVLPNGNA